jgi:hypothetical protein
MKNAVLRVWRRHVPPKRRFIINPHGNTSQKTASFIYCLLNDAVYISYYIKPNVMINSERLIRNNVEGSGCGLF